MGLLRFHDARLLSVLMFVTSLALPRRSILNFLLHAPLRALSTALTVAFDIRVHSGICTRRISSIVSNLYLPSLVKHNKDISWEQFRRELEELRLSSEMSGDVSRLVIDVNLQMQFTVLMCSVGNDGKLFDFQYLERGQRHEMQASGGSAFVCFRPSRILPIYITDLTEEQKIICAYVPPQYDAMGRYIVTISEINGELTSNFSCSLGSLEEVTMSSSDDSLAPAHHSPVKKKSGSLHLQGPAIKHQYCASPRIGKFSSPEIARQTPQNNERFCGFPDVDSPISLPGSLLDTVDYDMSLGGNTVNPPWNVDNNQITAAHSLNKKCSKEIPSEQVDSVTPSLPLIANLTDEAKEDRKLMQAKSKVYHENIKLKLRDLGYTKEETVAVKCCLTDYVKENYPALNSFERAEKMQMCVTKNIIDTLDIQKRLSAIRGSKIKKWVAMK